MTIEQQNELHDILRRAELSCERVMGKQVILHIRTGWTLNLDDICLMVVDEYGTSKEALRSKSRTRPLPEIRHVFMYFSCMYTKNSLKSIGDYLGGLDHSTVLNGRDAVRDRMDVDNAFKKFIHQLDGKINEKKKEVADEA